MAWNYRIIKSYWKLKHLKGVEYSIREVYYDKKGNPTSWTKEPQYLCSESLEELNDDLIYIKQAFKRPILEEIENKLITLEK